MGKWATTDDQQMARGAANTQGLLNDLRDDITKAFICEIPKGKTRKLKLLAYKDQIRQENDT